MCKKIITLMILSIFGALLYNNSVSAYTAIEQKALGYGVYRCYNHLHEGDSSNPVVVGEIMFDRLNSYENLILSNSSNGDSAIALPNGFDNLHKIEDDSNISCRDLFGGTDYYGNVGFSGLLENANVISDEQAKNGLGNDNSAKIGLLSALGYSTDSTTAYCYAFKNRIEDGYPQPRTEEVETDGVCEKPGSTGSFGVMLDRIGNNNKTTFALSGDEKVITMTLWTPRTQSGYPNNTPTRVYEKKEYTVSDYSSFQNLIDKITEDFNNHYRNCQVEDHISTTGGTRYAVCTDSGHPRRQYDSPGVSNSGRYALGDREAASINAINNLLGTQYGGQGFLAFDENEEYELYKNYFDNYYAAKLVCEYGDGQDTTETSLQNDGYSKIDEGALAGCYAKPTKNEDKEVYGLSEEKYFNGQVHLGFGDLIKKLSTSAEAADKSREDVINDIASDTTETPTNAQADTTCQNSGGAGSLGWIVCSILDWMANATEDLYDGVVKPALNVEPELFTDSGKNDGTEAAWNVFRNFANIIFTILVLFVIFSQLTGVGIDNYGIKKILPKLVAVAVLVNLSYLICLICVDLSNIVGNGVQQLFNNMSSISQELNIETIDGAETPEDASNKISVNVDGKNTSSNSSASGIGITAVAVAGAAIGVYAIYSNPALLLTLFIAVLGVLISILFVFILLAGRKAAIVLLTVLSPIAFILYMLPNTKKIFDKWLNLWKAMLLVYPICGLLIGGGNFASKLMLSVGNPSNAVTAFTAMIVGIVPIFFIPTVIKSAYAALGSMGGAIAGFGGRLSGGATRGMRNSRLNQNAQKRSQERGQRINAMRRAGVRLDKDGNVVESNRPTARLRRGLSGTWVGRRLGLEASMGQGAAEFTKLEAARRGNTAAGNNTDAMNATLAGLAGKESDQRVSDQETLMRAGKVMMGSEKLNVDNTKQMNDYHYQMLKTASEKKAAGDMAGYRSYMDKVKAAQNIMAKNDPGRGGMQQNYQNLLKSGDAGGLSDAASHLKGAHGPDIKAANRAMNSLIEDLAQGVDTASIQNKIDNHAYDIGSISGYNARSLVSADDGALDGLKNSVAAISSMTNENGENKTRDQLNALIDDALSNKNIQSQPKVEAKLRQIRDDLNRPSGGPYGYDGGGI